MFFVYAYTILDRRFSRIFDFLIECSSFIREVIFDFQLLNSSFIFLIINSTKNNEKRGKLQNISSSLNRFLLVVVTQKESRINSSIFTQILEKIKLRGTVLTLMI